MKRHNDDEIILTQAELSTLCDFIRSTLDRDWDDHTSRFFCKETNEEGMRRMDPGMYDMAQSMIII